MSGAGVENVVLPITDADRPSAPMDMLLATLATVAIATLTWLWRRSASEVGRLTVALQEAQPKTAAEPDAAAAQKAVDASRRETAIFRKDATLAKQAAELLERQVAQLQADNARLSSQLLQFQAARKSTLEEERHGREQRATAHDEEMVQQRSALEERRRTLSAAKAAATEQREARLRQEAAREEAAREERDAQRKAALAKRQASLDASRERRAKLSAEMSSRAQDLDRIMAAEGEGLSPQLQSAAA